MTSGQISTEAVALEMFELLGTGSSTPTITSRYARFDKAAGYAVIGPLRRLREARGEHVVGRKIGFTNQTIWETYGVDAPIWGYVYNTTLFDLTQAREPFRISHLSEPRIEPEIIFGLKKAPTPEMNSAELLQCCEWVSHGFEIVQSVFPGWRFKPADTLAAYGLHGALFVGPKHLIADRPAEWDKDLATFEIELLVDGKHKQSGRGANVLGSPLSALRYLVDVLASDTSMPPLTAGEIITTGTLTDAMPIVSGQTWTTRLRGISLEDARLQFG